MNQQSKPGLQVPNRSCLLVLSGMVSLLGGCDGPHEKAGKQADQAAGVKTGVLAEGPQQKLGALEDRADRDQSRAADAKADALKDRAKAIRSDADRQADALEAQAHQIRETAKQVASAPDTH